MSSNSFRSFYFLQNKVKKKIRNTNSFEKWHIPHTLNSLIDLVLV